MSELEAEKDRVLYTVVVQCGHPESKMPNFPLKAFVLPTGGLSATTYDEFRESAAKGGCAVRIFTAKASGVEEVKWELLHANATRLD